MTDQATQMARQLREMATALEERAGDLDKLHTALKRLAQRLHHTESCLERIAFRDGECECGQGLFVEGAEGKGAEGRPFDLLLARYRVECRRRELAEERLADTAPFLRLLMKVSLETREVVVQQQSWPLLETLADKAEKAVKKCQGVQATRG